MMRTIFSNEYFRPQQEVCAAFEITPTVGQRRLFVMGIPSGAPARGNTVHVPRTSHADARRLQHGARPAGTLPEDGRITDGPGGDSYWLRPIVGHVVRDAEGQLCEVVGHEFRALRRVVRGPQGQLLELLPAPGQTGGENVIDGELVDEGAPTAPQGKERFTGTQKGRAGRQGTDALRSCCRKLFADPGLPCVVELGKFQRVLAPQLAHPERLRDLHRLACYVQVYQALTRQRADEFLETIQGSVSQNIPMEPLTEESIAMLELKELLARHPRSLQNPLRDPGHVLPFECFYSLRLRSDPTAEKVEAAAAVVPGPPDKAGQTISTAAAPTNPAHAEAASSRRGIPERFQHPWEFRFSRDEVLYDMNLATTSRKSIATLLRNLGRWVRRREEFRKWRALLCAKNLEEQLWAVRPPRGSLSDPGVREWAHQTLEGAGYDSRTMLLEWEIFWRRKGV